MALTANMGSTLDAKYGELQTYVAGGTIYRGSTVVVKQGDGLVYAAEDDTDDSEKQVVVGIAQESAIITENIRVRMDGKWKRILQGSPAVVVGRLACVKDDETVQLYDANQCKVVVGRITEQPNATYVYVDFDDRPLRLATSAND